MSRLCDLNLGPYGFQITPQLFMNDNEVGGQLVTRLCLKHLVDNSNVTRDNYI